METFKYSALSRNGQKVKGVVDAFDELDAVARIKEECDVITSLTKVEEKTGLLNMELDAKTLNKKAFTLMCSQFSIILRAGVPIGRACHLIADKTTDKKLKKMLQAVSSDVEAGRSMADSFEDRGEVFLPTTFVETIRAGEESGGIAKAFETMYKHYDKQTRMADKVKGVMIYPIFVIVVAIVVVIVLMVKVVPTFTEIFEAMDIELPLITRMLIGISQFFRKWWPLMAFLMAAGMLFYKLYNNTEDGRLKLAKLQLAMPVLGNISTLNTASQFANTMTTMLGAGIPVTKAVSTTAKVIGNYHASQEVGKLTHRIEEGVSLGDAVRELDCLPDILKDMVAVGEETGEMEETLHTVAIFYDAELESAIDAAIKKLEPTLLCFIAVIAGFIVIAMYSAMFTMYEGF